MSEAGDAGPARHRDRTRLISGGVLAAVVIAAAVVALRLHRHGHGLGDDFALYINQARSLFEGNVAQVITDNRFLWQNSVAVTPPIYPWGFPILLSPFVHLWGIEAYDKLKVVEVAAFCVWLILFHGIVRRRTGRVIALALTVAFASAPLYLVHTDQLLTEFPHMAATATVIWWLDRLQRSPATQAATTAQSVERRVGLLTASTGQLVTLGLLMVAAYNMRRESIVLLAVLAAAMVVDTVGSLSTWRFPGGSVVSRLKALVRAIPWRRIGTPFLAFAVGAFLFQLLLPSTLIPDNGNSKRFITERLFSTDTKTKDYPFQLTLQLGIGPHPLLGLILMAIAAAGAIVACIRRPRLNIPIAVLTACTMLVVGTHMRMVARYYFQITPFIAYFALMLPISYAELLLGHRRLGVTTRRALLACLSVPALWIAALHVHDLPARLRAADRYNDSGQVQSGGVTEISAPAFAAIERYTDADDVIVYYRVRTMTLYTGRRGVQTTNLDKAARLGDYFMQNLQREYSQPKATENDLLARGWVVVWEDENWRLWEIPSG
jgi:hypothetical protein